MPFRARGGLAVALFYLVACGSSGGGGGGVQGTLTISPQTASAVIGGPAVSFTATLSGSSNAISWTLNGPGTIAPSGGSTTTYTPPPFGGSPVTATVTASAGAGVSASATVQVGVPTSIDVSGTVVGSDRVPIAGVNVTIGAQSVITGADGRFTISNVSLPYDLTAVLTSPKRGIVYQGLTRRDPTVVMLGVTATPLTGTVTGNLSGGHPLGGANESTRVQFASPEARNLLNGNDLFVASNPYSMQAAWIGPTTTTGTVHALQWQADGGTVPTSFTGYASQTGVSVSSGGNVAADLVMSAPPVSTVGGTIRIDPSLLYFGQSISITFPDAPRIVLGGDAPSGTFSYLVPNVGGATASLIAQAISSASNVSDLQMAGIPPGTTNLVVDLAAPPTPVAPADLATDIATTTVFTWTGMPGTVNLFGVRGRGTTPSPSYYVVTSGTSARIPDLAAQGLGLPPAAAYSWNVNTYGPLTSVDELAGAASTYLSGSGSYFGGTTAPRDFTTTL